MTRVPVRIAVAGVEMTLAETELPLRLERLVGGAGVLDWEVEIGFGKGRYLLGQARRRSGTGFLGIEVASKYYRHVRDRSRDLDNVVLLRGEAIYLMVSVLPGGFASVVHVYFPDPWPKSRHHGRRLFDPESLDLILRLLRPDGRLVFATDYLDYGALVHRLLEEHPALRVIDVPESRSERTRTHYEDKYERQGRPIVRLAARFDSGVELIHPRAGLGVVAAVAPSPDLDGDPPADPPVDTPVDPNDERYS